MSKSLHPSRVALSSRDRTMFFKRLGMMMRSGMPLIEGLQMLRAEGRGRHTVSLLESLVVDVSAGRTLSQALERYERQFGVFCVQVVRIGETSGRLRENIEYLADELRRTATLRRRVMGALVYPAVILAATGGIVALLVAYIFPKILPVLSGVQGTLPFSTRAVIALSAFVTEYGLLLLAGLVAGTGAFIYARRFMRFRYATDGLMLRQPPFGVLARAYNMAMLSRTLALLLRGGASIIPAFELTAASIRNAVYRAALVQVCEGHARGQKLSSGFAAYPRLFSALFVQMVSVGESTGNLADAFGYLSEVYEEEVNERTRDMTTLLEPILMVAMGLVVGFIAISIITPIYSITQSLGSQW